MHIKRLRELGYPQNIYADIFFDTLEMPHISVEELEKRMNFILESDTRANTETYKKYFT